MTYTVALISESKRGRYDGIVRRRFPNILVTGEARRRGSNRGPGTMCKPSCSNSVTASSWTQCSAA